MDRQSKEQRIRRNKEIAIARANRQYCHNFRCSEVPRKIAEMHEREFSKAAQRVDRGKLSEMWNE